MKKKDFRHNNWGDASSQIKRMEVFKLTDGYINIDQPKGWLLYKGIYMGKNAKLEYKFLNNKLIGVEVHFEPNFNAAKEYIEDYLQLSLELYTLHGTPSIGYTSIPYEWFSDEIEEDYGGDLSDIDEWSKALEKGLLDFQCEWETENTRITILLGFEKMYVAKNIKPDMLPYMWPDPNKIDYSISFFSLEYWDDYTNSISFE